MKAEAKLVSFEKRFGLSMERVVVEERKERGKSVAEMGTD